MTMKKKRIIVIVVFILLIVLCVFLFDQFSWNPLQQVLESDRWEELQYVRAYGEWGQAYELDLTLEDVRAAVFGRLARKHDKLRGLASPCIQIGIETVDGSLIEYAFSQDGIILVNSKFDGSPSPSWKTDYTVYEALTGEW